MLPSETAFDKFANLEIGMKRFNNLSDRRARNDRAGRQWRKWQRAKQ